MQKSAVLLLSTVAFAYFPALQAQTPLNQVPSRVVGQNALDSASKSTAPNVVEGREFSEAWGVAVDTSTNPPAVYVSDGSNHRVLGWKNATGFANGQKADLVIGQVDFVSTNPSGPGGTRSAGLDNPEAIAVDAQGNLYVADLGNNRILRFPKPFAQTGAAAALQVPDMVIGQTSLNSRTPNTGGISAATIDTADTSGGQTSGLAFDSAGNLWFSDSNNNRVLRYKASDLASGANGPSADLVLGQSSFTSNTLPPLDAATRAQKVALRGPAGLAFDPAGRLYVVDSLSRVVVFAPPFSNFMAGSRVMGIGDVTINNGQATSAPVSASTLNAPEGVFMVGNNPAVVDRGNSRILIYDPFEQWPAETPTPIPAGTSLVVTSPSAKFVIGQPDFASAKANKGLPEPDATSLFQPYAAMTANNEIYVADTVNNRVLVFPSSAASAVGTGAAVRVLGQDGFNFNAPNLIEGKEMFLYNGLGAASSGGGNLSGNYSDGAGVYVDNNSNPPHLYVADTFNNRVLGYKDARKVRPGDFADLVIGQPDFKRAVVNSPGGKADQPTATGLFHPATVSVDAAGNLWVADSGNGRVLRYPTPFAQSSLTGQTPNLVLGQLSFTSRFTDPTQYSMAYPYGIAFSQGGDVMVSDPIHNRVLFFRKPNGGDFSSAQSAEFVVGQPDFFTVQAGPSATRFGNPRGISTDTDDRLYVADAGASRVLIYDRITAVSTSDPFPALTITGLNAPQGIFVSRNTGEVWVADTRSNRALRFPRFDRLTLSSASDYSVPSAAPLGLAQDAFGNLFVAEGSNRIAIFYNALQAVNGASFSETRPLSPGMIGTLFPPAGSPLIFTDKSPAAAGAAPLPFVLDDTSVTVGGKPAPLYYVSMGQINYVVPYSIATSGTAEVQVTHPSTGQIVAAFTFPLTTTSPALFVMNSEGQVAALNDDNSVNSQSNPIARDHVLQIYATGGGPVSGAPPDGQAATGAVNTDLKPDVLIGTNFVDKANILYSGLAPGFPGMWQINVKVPNTVPPGPTDLVVRVNSALSNVGPGGARIKTVIWVKQ